MNHDKKKGCKHQKVYIIGLEIEDTELKGQYWHNCIDCGRTLISRLQDYDATTELYNHAFVVFKKKEMNEMGDPYLPQERQHCEQKYDIMHLATGAPSIDDMLQDLNWVCEQNNVYINIYESFSNMIKKEYQKWQVHPTFYNKISLLDTSLDRLNETVEEILESYKPLREATWNPT